MDGQKSGKIIDVASFRRKQMPSYIRETLEYLDIHFSEKISIDDLSEKLYVSKYHLMREFRQQTGKTIHGYLTERRIEAASEMISRGIPAQTAAEEAGYQDYSIFYKNFCKYMGISPKEYQNREEEPKLLEYTNVLVLREEFLQA
ncbi:MAG: helix-turn-helix transcriptional regulator [Hungatella sp.]|nr:helix-turn-helix transcriptional regulator [Hungatella sp.]